MKCALELFWRKAIARQLESVLTQNAFCEKEGLNPHNFSWWKREIALRDREKASNKVSEESQAIFFPVAIAETEASGDSGKPIAEADWSAGVVRIYAGIDRDALHEIMMVLREVAS